MTSEPRTFDVIVVGAGAAGLMCAATAGQRGRRVAVVDHNAQPGRKILISGGGRCNFTNIHCGPQNFHSENPHFAKSALAQYRPQHFLELVERYGIAWHEKTLGQLFCDGSARQIVDLLLAECERGHVELVLGTRVERIGDGFVLETSAGELRAGALVVATGSLHAPSNDASASAVSTRNLDAHTSAGILTAPIPNPIRALTNARSPAGDRRHTITIDRRDQ